MDIALAIPQSDFIPDPLLQPDWTSDVLPETSLCFPATASPVLLLLPEISSNPHPHLQMLRIHVFRGSFHILSYEWKETATLDSRNTYLISLYLGVSHAFCFLWAEFHFVTTTGPRTESYI